jgi:hypothetical protein
MNFRVTNSQEEAFFKGTLRDCLAVALNQRKQGSGFHHIDIKNDGAMEYLYVVEDESGKEWRYLAYINPSATLIETYTASAQAISVINKFAKERNIKVRKL